MYEEPKQMPFTKDDVINAVKNYHQADVDIRSCSSGKQHKYFYVSIGGTDFQDNGKYEYAYGFAQAVQKVFAEIEKELEQENIVFVRKTAWLEYKYNYTWRSTDSAEIECVVGIVKITPSKSFLELKTWLKENANFDLKATDLYDCDVCQKRSSKSYSNFYYFAADENYCKKLLERAKTECKGSAKIDEDEYIDNDPFRYEYEQYGKKRTSLQF